MGRLAIAGLASAALFACYSDSGTTVPLWPQAEVRLVTDDMGITHVFAQSDPDALFGNGYAMARDRLFQMEVYRRQALGTSAEIFGNTATSADLAARVFNFKLLGQQDEARTRSEQPDDATLADAWIAGVNARIAEVRSGAAPRPYGLGPKELDFVPNDWVTAETFAVGKLLAFGLSDTLDQDILATALLRLAPTLVQRLPILKPAENVFTLGELPALPLGLAPPVQRGVPASFQTAEAVGSVPPVHWAWFRGGDSNNWAVDAAHSANGHPLLAGDPHQALTSPSRLWPVHVSSAGGAMNVIGFAFPGTPAVQLGHNAHMGWTATTNFADVMDIWDVNTDSARTVVHLADGDHAIVDRTESIQIKGMNGTSASQSYTVEEVPGYGVLLPDAILPLPRSFLADGDAILFNWTGFAPTLELSAYFGVDRAGDVDAFDAAADLLDVGAVNFVAADASHIDYHVHAVVPDRGDPHTHPMPWHIMQGTDAESLWTGSVLGTDKLPSWRDPARGFLVTANNDPWGFTADGDVEDDPFYYGAYYANGFRAKRIEDTLARLVGSGQGVEPADLETLQDDTHSVLSDTALPLLAAAMAAIGTDPSLTAYVGRSDLQALATALAGWDQNLDRARGEPTVFTAFAWFAVKRTLYGDAPGPLFDAVAAKSPPFYLGMLKNILAGDFPGASTFVADAGGMNALLVGSLDDTSQWLMSRFGTTDTSGVAWGNFNLAAFVGAYGGAQNPPPDGVDGGSDSVKVCESAFFASGDPLPSMLANEVSVYRMVMSFGDDGVPVATIDFQRGTREDPTDPHFGDQEASWIEGAHAPLAFQEADVLAKATDQITLGPGGSAQSSSR